jgi:hypothetical protein
MQDKPAHKPKSPTVKSSGASRHRAAPMRPLRNICVYCGSGPGKNPAYIAAARELGTELAKAGIGLVYGGGSLGLMGEVARATLAHGGHVTGIIPLFLTRKERAIENATKLEITDDMHERKKRMFEMSDAFVALPGGLGTLEEFVEQLTWSQIGQSRKPMFLANIDGYWDPLLELIAHMRSERFIRPDIEVKIGVASGIPELISLIKSTERATAGEPPPS